MIAAFAIAGIALGMATVVATLRFGFPGLLVMLAVIAAVTAAILSSIH